MSRELERWISSTYQMIKDRKGIETLRNFSQPPNVTDISAADCHSACSRAPNADAMALVSNWLVSQKFASSPSSDLTKVCARYDALQQCLVAVQKLLASATGDWLLPLLSLLMRAARHATVVADAAIVTARNQGVNVSAHLLSHSQDDDEGDAVTLRAEKSEDFARVLNQIFTVCLGDRQPNGKKMGCLDVINNLLKIYFRRANLRMVPSLLRTVNNKGFPPLDSFPISQLVTYRFYLGRFEMLQGNYAIADAALSFAFERCTKRSPMNKLIALHYLIPIKMILGKMPDATLLRKYPIPLYERLARIIRLGDIDAFSSFVDEHQSTLIALGTFILTHRLRYIVFRVYLAKVALLSQVGTSCIVSGCKFLKTGPHLHISVLAQLLPSLESAEIECMIVNLITRKLVRGYLSHQAGILVLSKGNAFPPISEMLII